MQVLESNISKKKTVNKGFLMFPIIVFITSYFFEGLALLPFNAYNVLIVVLKLFILETFNSSYTYYKEYAFKGKQNENTKEWVPIPLNGFWDKSTQDKSAVCV
jgi:hypothetical protein